MSSSWHKPTLICVGAAVAVAAAIKVWKQRRALEAEPTPLELMALRNSLMHSEASMKAGTVTEVQYILLPMRAKVTK